VIGLTREIRQPDPRCILSPRVGDMAIADHETEMVPRIPGSDCGLSEGERAAQPLPHYGFKFGRTRVEAAGEFLAPRRRIAMASVRQVAVRA